jgi:hypothetical protein
MSDWGEYLFLSIITIPCHLLTKSGVGVEGSEDGSPVRPISNKAPVTKNKWEGEDEDNDEPVVRAPIGQVFDPERCFR